MTFAKKCYGGSISAIDTDAAKLTLEQAAQVATWADYQPSEYFQERPLQFALDMYHVTAAWDTIQGLREEADMDELRHFTKAFNAGLKEVCGLRGEDYNQACLRPS